MATTITGTATAIPIFPPLERPFEELDDVLVANAAEFDDDELEVLLDVDVNEVSNVCEGVEVEVTTTVVA
jgi:hypothetical protein